MRRLMLSLTLFIVASVHAAPETPGLLPTPIARPQLEQDPSVAGARAMLEAARLEAAILEGSPYEWTAKLSSQRRNVESGQRYREWNAGVERGLRLPGKAAADANLAKATIAEGEALRGQAMREAARDLLTLWLDALGTERGRDLAEANRNAALENRQAVEKRVRAGDASRLDASLAQGELAEQERIANDASTQATVAWSRLQARFPGIGRSAGALSDPVRTKEDLSYWRTRILDRSDALKIVQAHLQQAYALRARASAERIPDPTIGLYSGSEVDGQERIVGITVTIPFPGGQRSRRAEKAVYSLEAARQAVELKKRELEAEIAASVATAEGTYRGLQIAEAGAAAMQDNAKLMQRAYSLGEADLQSLLSSRRQATTATQSALSARIAALKAHYLLLIDAQLVWDLDKD